MQAGKLNKRISLTALSETTNSFGEQTGSYASYATVWAAIEPLSGRELEHAQQISAEITHKITVRYNSSVTSKHRITYGSRTFEIEAVLNPDERNEQLVLMCKEIA